MSEEQNIPEENLHQESEIINPASETNPMEVHKHPHHVTHSKKWFEYLLEFIMLFLAVFLGFVAENIREKNHEIRKEKEYAYSMYEDLKTDTFLLRREVLRIMSIGAKADSAVKIIQAGSFTDTNVNILYKLNRRFLSPLGLVLTDRTSAQLKNAGGMQLLNNKMVIEGITNYWHSEEALMEQKSNINESRAKAREKTFSIFDNKYYLTIMQNDFSLVGHPKLMTNDQLILTEFSNRLSWISGLYRNIFVSQLNRQITEAEKLLNILKDNYHIKN